jgi:hypothetical protein
MFLSLAQQQSNSSGSGGGKSGSIYNAFILGAQYGEESIGANEKESVLVRHVGFTNNVQIPGDRLNVGKAGRHGWKDPMTSFHGGAESYYFGGPLHLLGFNAGRVAAGAGRNASSGLEAHHDFSGLLNPMHWLFEALPSLVINARNSAIAQPYTCSIRRCPILFTFFVKRVGDHEPRSRKLTTDN